MSDSLCSPGPQHVRLSCPAPCPGARSNSSPLSWWCHPAISPSVFLLLPSIFPSIRVFSSEFSLSMRWPKYWSFSFSISPSNEYSGLISFEIDWFNLATQGTLKSLLSTTIQKYHSLVLSLLYGPTLTSIYDYWKNHSFDCMNLCWQDNVFDFLLCCLGWS